MLKKLRIGFAAIIALLALTATVASHAGVFNAKIAKAAQVTGCYTFVQNTDNPPVELEEGQLPPSELPENKIVDETALGTLVTNPTPNGQCPESEVICCIEVFEGEITGFVLGDFQPIQ